FPISRVLKVPFYNIVRHFLKGLGFYSAHHRAYIMVGPHEGKTNVSCIGGLHKAIFQRFREVLAPWALKRCGIKIIPTENECIYAVLTRHVDFLGHYFRVFLVFESPKRFLWLFMSRKAWFSIAYKRPFRPEDRSPIGEVINPNLYIPRRDIDGR